MTFSQVSSLVVPLPDPELPDPELPEPEPPDPELPLPELLVVFVIPLERVASCCRRDHAGDAEPARDGDGRGPEKCAAGLTHAS